jgi:hypothetical protein
MRYLYALACLFFLSISTPLFAHEGNRCADESAKIANHDEQAAFLKSCLEQDAIHENSEKVEETESKVANCEQNAKNLKLEGQNKEDYLLHCYNEDHTKPEKYSYPKK